ncbi:phage holin [Streptococcus sp. ZJ100]|uniref:phage holin n=1 Tax=Streptococcus handemini TaxID=3161188 RepID=UPI0032EAA747
MINWRVRFKNKAFWLAFIPAIALVVQNVGKLFGFEIEVTQTVEGLLNVINAVFVVLAIIGIVNDPTTATLSDSVRALSYETPKED